MSFSGKQIDDNYVMFGPPLNEKAFEALKRNSPDGNAIIKSLPKSAFIPVSTVSSDKEILKMQEEQKLLEEKEQIKKDQQKVYNRLARKKALAKQQEQQKKETIIEKIVSSQPIKEDNHMDLDAELEQLSKEIEQKETPKVSFSQPIQEEIVEQPEMKDQILQLFSKMKDKPSQEMIAAWKEKYGPNGVHVMAFGEGDIYVYHHLTRGEWKKIKELMNKMKESSGDVEEIEEKLKEKVVLYCVLWPSVDNQWLEYCKAGVLDSLYQMILLNSGFLTPQQAMLLTTQL